MLCFHGSTPKDGRCLFGKSLMQLQPRRSSPIENHSHMRCHLLVDAEAVQKISRKAPLRCQRHQQMDAANITVTKCSGFFRSATQQFSGFLAVLHGTTSFIRKVFPPMVKINPSILKKELHFQKYMLE